LWTSKAISRREWIQIQTAERGSKGGDRDYFTINEVTAFATPAEAAATAATAFNSFSNSQEPAKLAMGWPTERLVATGNSLSGVTPVKNWAIPDFSPPIVLSRRLPPSTAAAC
jgi:hypothetical protein